MGYAYDELIAPAVLFDNPGLTKKEYVNLLAQAHPSSFHEYEYDYPWGSFKEDPLTEQTYHNGLEGLANILGIEFSKSYDEFMVRRKDENGLSINPPFRCTLREEDRKALNKKWEVLVHLENKIDAETVVKEISYDQLKEGEIWRDWAGEVGLITKILNETYQKDEDEFSPGPEYSYELKIKPIKSTYKQELFETEEELYKKWPQFDPNNMYDWNQKEGGFATIFRAKNCFYWVNKNGKYYIDEKSFDIMPASSNLTPYHILGYTDMILTAEAVKKKAWKLISYRGLKHLEQFLTDFPDSRLRYERAVWDSHTSLGAKHMGMTVSEFLRFRLLPP